MPEAPRTEAAPTSGQPLLRRVAWRVTTVLSGLTVVAALAVLVRDVGFELAPVAHAEWRAWMRVLVVLAAVLYALRLALAEERRLFLQRYGFDMAVLGAAGLTLVGVFVAVGFDVPSLVGDTVPGRIDRIALRLAIGLLALVAGGRQVARLTTFDVHPAVALLGVFAFAIALGTGLLMLPAATEADGALPFIDALFTAASAVCVTGLVVVPTGPTFTPMGEGIILALFQLGGIGIISAATAVAVLFGRRTPLGTQLMLRRIQDTRTIAEVKTVLREILLVTLLIEAVGAGLIYLSLGAGGTVDDRVYYSIFHAVSAFCNAGFTTVPTSLAGPGLADNVPLNLVFMALIVLGGIGFVVLRATFWPPAWRSRAPGAASYHLQARLVWSMTAVLVVTGAVAFFLLERDASLAASPALDSTGDWVLASFFQSITARTAGFNTVDVGATSAGAALVLLMLMFIGASPGSTGGGLRTTTVALLVLYVVANVRGVSRVDVLGRTIRRRTMHHAVVLLLVGLALVVAATLLLTVMEQARFLDLLFEVVSAFGTVGLSRGVTSDLSAGGKAVVVAMMYLGRVGLLAFAVLLSDRAHHRAYDYPEEAVMLA